VATGSALLGQTWADVPGTALNLPAGNYVVSWSLNARVSALDPAAAQLTCTLRENAIQLLDSHRGGIAAGLLNLGGQGAITLANPTTVHLSCKGGADTEAWTIDDPQITALKVDTLLP